MQIRPKYPFLLRPLCFLAALAAATPAWTAPPSVSDAMDAIVTRLYAELGEADLAKLDDAAIASRITADERTALATKHWYFDVDVPVVVSLLRESTQAVLPFWIEEAGFKKTSLEVTNIEGWRYEVWQKSFDAGHIGLGINGFDKHRPHYLVSVGPQQPGATVNITNLHPARFSIETTRPGATCYHDWSENVLKDVPEALLGQQLLTTIRGRARDAHLIGGFRSTAYPSSNAPDQIMLTWSDDPTTTQTIQWRTSPAVPDGAVRWREKTVETSRTTAAQVTKIQDRMLVNDRFAHRHTATLAGLKPGTTYVYTAGSPSLDVWSAEAEFTTAPEANGPVTFFVTGDTHQKESWGTMMEGALARHPEAAFYVIAGDLVNTGQYRSDWDEFFHHGRNLFNRIPLMPSLGNHDVIDGLGPEVFKSLFELPKNGPDTLDPEQAYSFTYGNVLFINLDCTAEIHVQDAWLEETLKNTKATWKLVSFHFPNYDPEYKADYQVITDHWGSLFDTYHVDLVFQGHTHRYLRTRPVRGGKVMGSPAEGTIYLVSIAIPNRAGRIAEAEYIEKALSGTPLYQVLRADENELTVEARDSEGTIHDAITLVK